MEIVTDITVLKTVSEPVKSIKDGANIARKLSSTLARINKKSDKKTLKFLIRGQKNIPTMQKGIGLSAVQLGILKRVFIVDVNNPISFINPKIVNYSEEEISWVEECLSLPGTRKSTKRWLWVELECLGWNKPRRFGWYNPEQMKNPRNLLESIVIQHEFDHLNGRLISDFPQENDIQEAEGPDEII